jgi:hypothetical protein
MLVIVVSSQFVCKKLQFTSPPPWWNYAAVQAAALWWTIERGDVN